MCVLAAAPNELLRWLRWDRPGEAAARQHWDTLAARSRVRAASGGNARAIGREALARLCALQLELPAESAQVADTTPPPTTTTQATPKKRDRSL